MVMHLGFSNSSAGASVAPLSLRKMIHILKRHRLPCLLAFSFFLAPARSFARTCYFLDGNEAVDDVPCSPNQYTNCCNQNDVCMSNGLCYVQGQRGFALSRGTCTDVTWGSNCTAPCSGCMYRTYMSIYCFIPMI
jgi:hypothetical protein